MFAVIAGKYIPSKQITALKWALSNDTNTKDRTEGSNSYANDKTIK